MLRIRVLVFLSILTVPPPVFGQTSSDADFRARVLALRMAEKVLMNAKMYSVKPEVVARQLKEFKNNIEVFQALGQDLSAFLSLDVHSRSDRQAIERKSKDVEKSADRLMSFVGGKGDDSLEGSDASTLREVLDELSKTIVRVRPKLVQSLEMVQKNLIDVRVQEELIKDLHTVKTLSRRLRD